MRSKWESYICQIWPLAPQSVRTIANVRIPNANREKLDTKSEKCIRIAYKSFNLWTRAVQVSRDIVIDESASWYELDSTLSNPIEEELNAISDDDIRPNPLPKDNPSSAQLSGPHEPSRDESTSRPSSKSDKGKGKMPEYELDHPDGSDSDASALWLASLVYPSCRHPE